MLRFIKALWFTMLAAAATFTSCVRLDADARTTRSGQPAPAQVEASRR